MLACLQAALAAVELPAWFGDNMVLQTNAEYGARSVLGGRAKPGEKVSVKNYHQHELGGDFPATADADGVWQVQMDHVSQSGPTDVSVKGSVSV